MPRKTIVRLEAEIEHLKRHNRLVEEANRIFKKENNMLAQQLDMLQRYISTMTIGGEKLADALSHAIGFVTDRGRIVEGRRKEERR